MLTFKIEIGKDKNRKAIGIWVCNCFGLSWILGRHVMGLVGIHRFRDQMLIRVGRICVTLWSSPGFPVNYWTWPRYYWMGGDPLDPAIADLVRQEKERDARAEEAKMLALLAEHYTVYQVARRFDCSPNRVIELIERKIGSRGAMAAAQQMTETVAEKMKGT